MTSLSHSKAYAAIAFKQLLSRLTLEVVCFWMQRYGEDTIQNVRKERLESICEWPRDEKMADLL
jgi:hypothetical protein